MEAYITRYQASIFTPELIIGNYSKFIGLFQNIGGEKLNGQIISIPISQDMPLEIPRLILSATDDSWKVQMTTLRTDVLYNRIGMLNEEIPNSSTFIDFACEIFSSFLNYTETSVQRLSCIKERVLDIGDEDPAYYIARRFCRDKFLTRPFNEPDSFEIHALKKYNWKILESVNVNSWVRVKSAYIDKIGKAMVFVVNDFNTFSAKEAPENRFNMDQIYNFYRCAPGEIESIFKLYFGEQ